MQIQFLPTQSLYKYKPEYKNSTRPQFGQLNKDIFVYSSSSAENETISDNKLISLLNIGKKEKLNFSQATLDTIRQSVLSEKSDERQNLNLAALGHRVGVAAIRKYLLFALPDGTSFYHSLHAKSMIPLLHGSIFSDNSEAQANNKTSNTHLTDKEKLQKYFFRVLGSIYLNEPEGTVYKYLEQHIDDTMKNDDVDKMNRMLNWYYFHALRGRKHYTYEVRRVSSKKFIATDYIDGEKINEVTAKTQNGAAKKLLITHLQQIGLHHSQMRIHNDKVPTRKYVGSQPAKDKVEYVLSRTGFLKPEDKLDKYNDAEKIYYILHSLKLHGNKNLFFNFDALEHYGDGVINLLVTKFLCEKTLPKEKFKYYFSLMTGNKSLPRYTLTLGLQNYVDKGDCYFEMDIKRLADLFEAYVGALHLSFSEERVYNYLKPLFELMLKDIQKHDMYPSRNESNKFD